MPEDCPVIVGIPPPPNSIHSRGRRKFLNTNKTEDREGPSRQVPVPKISRTHKVPTEGPETSEASRKGEKRGVHATSAPASGEETRPSIESGAQDLQDGWHSESTEENEAPSSTALDQSARSVSLPDQSSEERVKPASGAPEKGGGPHVIDACIVFVANTGL